MRKDLQLSSSISALNPAKFEKMIGDIIKSEYKNIKNYNHKGSMSDKDKTKPGTPDIWFTNERGNYVFVEITTKNDALEAKIKEDIEKCEKFAKDKSVDEIIYACDKDIDPNKFKEYETQCNSFNVEKFTFWGISELMRILSYKYLNISKEYLGTYVQKGSVKSLDEFINNKFDVSQDHKFSLRDEDIKDVKSILENDRKIVLFGKAGCGKTRLATEVANSMNGFEKLVVHNQGSTISNDLSDIISDKSKNFVLIVDDANRNNYFVDIDNLSNEHKNLYLIITTRDYGKHIFNDYSIKQKEISTFTLEELESVLTTAFPKIATTVIRHIKIISRGNLRFAIMAANLHQERILDIKNINQLIEKHFESIDKDKNIFEKATLKSKKVIAVIALLQKFGLYNVNEVKNQKIKEAILNISDVSYEEFLEILKYWENKELINYYTNPMIIEIADQILGTYIFKKFVLEDGLVSFEKIICTFFPEYKNRIRDLVQSILYISESDLVVRPVKEMWKKVQKEEKNIRVEYLKYFASLLQKDAIDFAYEELKKIPEERRYPSKEENKVWTTPEYYNSLMNILAQFESQECYTTKQDLSKYVIEVIFDLLEKNNKLYLELSEVLKAYTLSNDSYRYDYKSQIILFKTLYNNLEKGDLYQELFLDVTEKHIKHIHEYSWTDSDRNAVVFSQIAIIFNNESKQYRDYIWNGLKKLAKSKKYQNKILELTKGLKHSFNLIKDKEYRIYEEKQASELFKIFEDSLLVKVKKFDLFEFSEDKEIKKNILQLKNDYHIKIYDELINDRELNFYDKNYESIVNKYLDKQKDLKTFINAISELDSLDLGIDWKIARLIELFFAYINGNYPDKYIEYFKLYVSRNNMSSINPYHLIKSAFSYQKPNELLEYLVKADLNFKNNWIAQFYIVLPNHEITDDLYNKCLNFFMCELDDMKMLHGNINIMSLRHYEEYKKGFVLTLIKNYLTKSKSKWTHFYESMFNEYNSDSKDVVSQCLKFLNGDEQTLSDLYFKLIMEGARLYDLNFKVIKYLVNKDIEYLYKYAEISLDEFDDYKKMEFIFDYPNCADILLEIISRDKTQIFVFSFGVEQLLKKLSDTQWHYFVIKFFDKYKSDDNKIFYLSSIINDMAIEREFHFVDLLIEKKYDVILFGRLRLFGTPSSWSGSMTHHLQSALDNLTEYLKNKEYSIKNKDYIAKLEEIKNYLKIRIKQNQVTEINEDFRF